MHIVHGMKINCVGSGCYRVLQKDYRPCASEWISTMVGCWQLCRNWNPSQQYLSEGMQRYSLAGRGIYSQQNINFPSANINSSLVNIELRSRSLMFVAPLDPKPLVKNQGPMSLPEPLQKDRR